MTENEIRFERFTTAKPPALPVVSDFVVLARYISPQLSDKGFCKSLNRYVRERLTRHAKRRSQRGYKPAEGVSFIVVVRN